MAKGAVQARKKKARKASKEMRENRFFRQSKSSPAPDYRSSKPKN